ncbi:AAA domain-containing protein [Citrus sinensis]|nr:AAA domain-containing protein [Citrus sinensis]
MVEIAVTLVLEVVKCLAPPTESRLRYLRNYDANIERLKAEMEKLRDESTRIQRRVSEATAKGEETNNKRCLKGLCPDFRTRYQLSKKAETEMKAIVELREEAGKFDRISYRTVPEEIWLKSHKGYESFESRLSTLKAIQNALSDLNVSIIGVYGMAGIGKTTLVKEVARKVKEDKLFDQVAFSVVSQNPNIKMIQRDITEKLDLVFCEEVESRRANRLYERLKGEKKILIVLDNIWKHVDLESVGIPFGDEHKGCKVLLTARHRNVLLSMGSKDNFLIGNLNEEEAWRLFKTMAGDDVENRRLKSTVTDVAKACGGLPIALTTIGRAMRDKSVLEWKNALRELLTPSVVNFEGVPAEAYSSIELSFKYLKGEQLKKIFLLCSLVGNFISTSFLFKCCMGLAILQRPNKMEDAYNKLHALLHELKDSCFLVEGGSNEVFSMHDVIRDVAISIACRDQRVFLVRNEDVWEWPNEDALKQCHAISLLNSSIRELPEGLECPHLEFLLMDCKATLIETNIPEKLFSGMRKLKVVDMARMRLFSLLSSIDLLVNLQM